MPDSVPFDPTSMIETRADGRLDLDKVPECTPAQIRALAAAAVAHGHLVVHLHGGLVDSQRGRGGAAALKPHYEAAGAFPVAIVWNTGPIEVVCGNLDEIVKEDLFKELLRLVLTFAAGRLQAFVVGGRGQGFALPSDLDVRRELAAADREPFAAVGGRPKELAPEERTEFEEAVRADLALQEAADNLVRADAGARGLAAFAAAAPVKTHLDAGILAEIGGGAAPGTGKGILEAAALAKHAGAVLVRVVSRFAKGRDHGPLATCVEELAREFYLADAGGTLWQVIKTESADTFEVVAGEDRGGRLFVDELAAASAVGGPPRITVVGHSAGSIYACHLLRALAEKGLRVGDLVFLAAAVRYDLFAETLTTLGDTFAPERQHFFGLTDERESGYWEVPGFYPRSLLYMVSGAAERGASGESVADEPLVGMQRFFANPELVPTKTVHAAMRNAPSLVWVDRNPDGSGLKHGGLASPEAAPTVVAAVEAIVRKTP